MNNNKISNLIRSIDWLLLMVFFYENFSLFINGHHHIIPFNSIQFYQTKSGTAVTFLIGLYWSGFHVFILFFFLVVQEKETKKEFCSIQSWSNNKKKPNRNDIIAQSQIECLVLFDFFSRSIYQCDEIIVKFEIFFFCKRRKNQTKNQVSSNLKWKSYNYLSYLSY